MKILLYSSSINYRQSRIGEHKFYKELINEGYIISVYNPKTNIRSLLDKIARSELCLFECSIETIELGLLIQKSLEMEKPVIAFFSQKTTPQFVKLITNEKFQYFRYTNASLEAQLKSALQKASLLTDRRFNFFINSNMLAYLTKVSKKMGVTKSTFIRNLIEEYRRKNP